MTLDEARAHLHDRVVYRPTTPTPGASPAEAMEGVITPVGSLWAFVRYSTDRHNKATDPSQLELA